MKLLIVESPNKVKKIQGFLGDGWKVMASVGHVRDLPRKELGVDEKTFQPKYVFIPPFNRGGGKPFPGGKERVARIAKVAKNAEAVYLATDPDREGEAIAWHLNSAMSLDGAWRVTFPEITEKAVKAAIAAPRRIDCDLVRAQEARRVLDRLYGYKVSRILSNHAGDKRSAGRVQSPAVRLVVERERAIRHFKPTSHYGVELSFDGDWKAKWSFDALLPATEKYWLDKGFAEKVAAVRKVQVARYDVADKRQAPPAPFTTSSMQQAASVKIKLRPKACMDAAQKLFEAGAITYHRTDDPNLSEEAFDDIEGYAKTKALPVNGQHRKWKSKGGAQEAHEAIRPTHIDVESAGDDDAQQALYGLIRGRTLAAVLEDAVFSVRTAILESDMVDDHPIIFLASGKTLKTPGWKVVYDDTKDDDGDTESEADNPVPALQKGESLTALDGRVVSKKTKAPARYTEASLIKDMEGRGIGRPSTYAAIMENIINREYVNVDKKRKLHAGETGESIIDALAGNFRFVDLAFTAELEDQLDKIAHGNLTYGRVVGAAARELNTELGSVKADNPPAYPCPECGSAMCRRNGRTGHFWGCSNYPDCKKTMKDDNGKPVEKKQPALSKEFNCADCGSPLVHRVKAGKGGYDFWGCSGFPKCKKTYETDGNGHPAIAGQPA